MAPADLRLSTRCPEIFPSQPADITVHLSARRSIEHLAYDVEENLGNRGFLQLQALGPDDQPLLYTHPAGQFPDTGATAGPRRLDAHESRDIPISLGSWFQLPASGTIQVTASYRLRYREGKIPGDVLLKSDPLKIRIQPATRETVTQGLQSGEPAMLRAACENVAAAPGQDTADRLLALLDHPDTQVRGGAAEGLRKLKYAPSLPVLLERLRQHFPSGTTERFRMVTAIGALSRNHPDPLLAALSALPNPLPAGQREYALSLYSALKEAAPPGALEKFMSLLRSDDPAARIIAAGGLERIRDPVSLPPLLEACLKENDPRAMTAILGAAAAFESENAMDCFRHALTKGPREARAEAAIQAKSLHNMDILPELLPLLRSDSWLERKHVIATLHALTGRKFPYQYDAPPADREYQATQWETWWKDTLEARRNPPHSMMSNAIHFAAGAIAFVVIFKIIMDFASSASSRRRRIPDARSFIKPAGKDDPDPRA
ncbi:MAG: hypothetical protein GMKNLPBB_02848 [Myxococcota bacterium]|nr:hypothetical protein [Myxococcota bacterium]